MQVEQIGDCTLYCGDCQEILPTIAPVDATITDPPYGVELTRKTNDYRESRFYDNGASLQASHTYNDNPSDIQALLHNVMPLLLQQSTRVALFCGHRLLHTYPAPTSIGCVYIANGAGRDPWGFGCFNPILYYGKCPYLAQGKGSYPNSFSDNQPSREHIDHPCPKPLAWMTWLVQRASLPNEVVLDPFMGSGTTGIACIKLSRRFIGIEIDQTYFDLACRRIEQAYRQLDLFRPALPTPQQQPLFTTPARRTTA